MEIANIKTFGKFFLRFGAQLFDLQLANLVGQCLARVSDVAVDLIGDINTLVRVIDRDRVAIRHRRGCLAASASVNSIAGSCVDHYDRSVVRVGGVERMVGRIKCQWDNGARLLIG